MKNTSNKIKRHAAYEQNLKICLKKLTFSLTSSTYSRGLDNLIGRFTAKALNCLRHYDIIAVKKGNVESVDCAK